MSDIFHALNFADVFRLLGLYRTRLHFDSLDYSQKLPKG